MESLCLYEGNGHNRAKLKHIADTYTPPTMDNRNNNNNKNKTRRATKHNTPQTATETEAKTLFDVLPFVNENLTQEEEDQPYACINYIPGIAPQLKRAFTKAGANITFTSSAKLKDTLCSQNKTHAPKEKKKGIYKYTCTCSDKAIYIGQTHRSCEIRWKEHERAINNEQWHHSGITQHYEHCTNNFNKDNFTVVHTMQDKKKGRLAYNLKVKEAFEIRRHDCGPGRGLNEDNGAYLKTDIWDAVLNALDT